MATTASVWAQDASEPHVFRLEYTAGAFACYPFNADVQWLGKPAGEAREFSDPDALAGSMNTGPDPESKIEFLWLPSKGALHIDLNRNGDLADDEAYKTNSPGSSKNSQTFPGVVLAGYGPTESRQWKVDIMLYSFGSHYQSFQIGMRSGWKSEIELAGKKYLLGTQDNLSRIFSDKESSSRDRMVFLGKPGDSLGNVSNSDNSIPLMKNGLFLDGRMYDLEFDFEDSESGETVAARFTERQDPMGACELAGKDIQRATLTGDGATAVLFDPIGTLPLPCGDYSSQKIVLGRTDPQNRFSAERHRNLLIEEGTTATLKMGGPLANRINVARQGRTFELSYSLVGAGGEKYESGIPNYSNPPQFLVYKNDRIVDSGKFEYG